MCILLKPKFGFTVWCLISFFVQTATAAAAHVLLPVALLLPDIALASSATPGLPSSRTRCPCLPSSMPRRPPPPHRRLGLLHRPHPPLIEDAPPPASPATPASPPRQRDTPSLPCRPQPPLIDEAP